jgi:hypothetical protein
VCGTPGSASHEPIAASLRPSPRNEDEEVEQTVMIFPIERDSQRSAIGAALVFVILPTLAVCLRVIAGRIAHRSIDASDYCVIAACVRLASRLACCSARHLQRLGRYSTSLLVPYLSLVSSPLLFLTFFTLHCLSPLPSKPPPRTQPWTLLTDAVVFRCGIGYHASDIISDYGYGPITTFFKVRFDQLPCF